MCEDNSITTSLSRFSVVVVAPFILGGFIASSLGAELSWGEVVIIPFILTFFLNKPHRYCFADSGFTVKWIICKHFIPTETIKQIDVFGTKSGTWIVVELNGTPAIALDASRLEILSYCLQHQRKSFLILLKHGEYDKALELLQKYFPQKVHIAF